MANYSGLKDAIANVIKTNGIQGITGAALQSDLFLMIDTLGEVPFRFASGVAAVTSVISTGANLKAGATYRIHSKTGAQIADASANIGLWVKANGAYTKIKQYTPAELYAGAIYDYTATDDCELFIRTTQAGIPWTCNVGQVLIDFASLLYGLMGDAYANALPAIIADKSGTATTTAILRDSSVRLKAGATYEITARTVTQIAAANNNIGLWKGENGTYSKIKQYTSAELYAGQTFQYTPGADCDLYLRTTEVGISWTMGVALTQKDCAGILWGAIAGDGAASDWAGARAVLLGDSITAQGNGDAPSTNSFLYWASKDLGFANFYIRGIGGQTYIWNASGWYCEAGGTGGYLGRYNYDEDGNILSSVVSPETATAQDIANIEAALGKTIEIHYGAMCSWDRIKTMIPASLRTDIDLVILCAGTNDFQAVEDVDVDGDLSAAEPHWVPNDATDPTWANDSTYYLGGDYDITTFAGAIASAVMKARVWCPNAVVVVATPFPRFNTTTKQQYTNASGLTFREMCAAQKTICGFIGAPVVDANGECGISGADFTDLVVDGVHPNLAGRKMYGRPFVGGLTGIAKKIQ